MSPRIKSWNRNACKEMPDCTEIFLKGEDINAQDLKRKQTES